MTSIVGNASDQLLSDAQSEEKDDTIQVGDEILIDNYHEEAKNSESEPEIKEAAIEEEPDE